MSKQTKSWHKRSIAVGLVLGLMVGVFGTYFFVSSPCRFSYSSWQFMRASTDEGLKKYAEDASRANPQLFAAVLADPDNEIDAKHMQAGLDALREYGCWSVMSLGGGALSKKAMKTTDQPAKYVETLPIEARVILLWELGQPVPETRKRVDDLREETRILLLEHLSSPSSGPATE